MFQSASLHSAASSSTDATDASVGRSYHAAYAAAVGTPSRRHSQTPWRVVRPNDGADASASPPPPLQRRQQPQPQRALYSKPASMRCLPTYAPMTGPDGPSAAGRPSLERRASVSMNSNPLKSDTVLSEMLNDLSIIKEYDAFTSWRDSFLERFQDYLGEVGTEKARFAYVRFQRTMEDLVDALSIVTGYFNRGCITLARVTVRARQAINQLHILLVQARNEMQALAPVTTRESKTCGYNKFHIGAVLIAEGFKEYERCNMCIDILIVLDDMILEDVASNHFQQDIYKYRASILQFCDLMQDLGVYDVILKSRTFAEVTLHDLAHMVIPDPPEGYRDVYVSDDSDDSSENDSDSDDSTSSHSESYTGSDYPSSDGRDNDVHSESEYTAIDCSDDGMDDATDTGTRSNTRSTNACHDDIDDPDCYSTDDCTSSVVIGDAHCTQLAQSVNGFQAGDYEQDIAGEDDDTTVDCSYRQNSWIVDTTEEEVMLRDGDDDDSDSDSDDRDENVAASFIGPQSQSQPQPVYNCEQETDNTQPSPQYNGPISSKTNEQDPISPIPPPSSDPSSSCSVSADSQLLSASSQQQYATPTPTATVPNASKPVSAESVDASTSFNGRVVSADSSSSDVLLQHDKELESQISLAAAISAGNDSSEIRSAEHSTVCSMEERESQHPVPSTAISSSVPVSTKDENSVLPTTEAIEQRRDRSPARMLYLPPVDRQQLHNGITVDRSVDSRSRRVSDNSSVDELKCSSPVLPVSPRNSVGSSSAHKSKLFHGGPLDSTKQLDLIRPIEDKASQERKEASAAAVSASGAVTGITEVSHSSEAADQRQVEQGEEKCEIEDTNRVSRRQLHTEKSQTLVVDVPVDGLAEQPISLVGNNPQSEGVTHPACGHLVSRTVNVQSSPRAETVDNQRVSVTAKLGAILSSPQASTKPVHFDTPAVRPKIHRSASMVLRASSAHNKLEGNDDDTKGDDECASSTSEMATAKQKVRSKRSRFLNDWESPLAQAPKKSNKKKGKSAKERTKTSGGSSKPGKLRRRASMSSMDKYRQAPSAASVAMTVKSDTDPNLDDTNHVDIIADGLSAGDPGHADSTVSPIETGVVSSSSRHPSVHTTASTNSDATVATVSASEDNASVKTSKSARTSKTKASSSRKKKKRSSKTSRLASTPKATSAPPSNTEASECSQHTVSTRGSTHTKSSRSNDDGKDSTKPSSSSSLTSKKDKRKKKDSKSSAKKKKSSSSAHKESSERSLHTVSTRGSTHTKDSRSSEHKKTSGGSSMSLSASTSTATALKGKSESKGTNDPSASSFKSESCPGLKESSDRSLDTLSTTDSIQAKESHSADRKKHKSSRRLVKKKPSSSSSLSSKKSSESRKPSSSTKRTKSKSTRSLLPDVEEGTESLKSEPAKSSASRRKKHRSSSKKRLRSGKSSSRSKSVSTQLEKKCSKKQSSRKLSVPASFEGGTRTGIPAASSSGHSRRSVKSKKSSKRSSKRRQGRPRRSSDDSIYAVGPDAVEEAKQQLKINDVAVSTKDGPSADRAATVITDERHEVAKESETTSGTADSEVSPVPLAGVSATSVLPDGNSTIPAGGNPPAAVLSPVPNKREGMVEHNTVVAEPVLGPRGAAVASVVEDGLYGAAAGEGPASLVRETAGETSSMNAVGESVGASNASAQSRGASVPGEGDIVTTQTVSECAA